MTANGWPAVPVSATTRVVVGGDADGCTVLSGDVATAFVWLMNRFHAEVEPLRKANGHRTAAYNASIGGLPSSNHISGTAVDLNGDAHPYERNQPPGPYRSGFTDEQVRAVRKIIADAGGLFAWGLDFPKGYRDAMHFELANGTTAADVRRFVESVRKDDIVATLDQEDREAILEIVKNGVAQVLVEGLNPAAGDAGKRGRNVRDALHGIVGSAGTSNAVAENVAWLRTHGQAGLARLLREQGVSVSALSAKLTEVGVDASEAARIARELLDG